ncbi:glycosyltransferase family 2 protein [Fulvivirgaceae bacterium BMA10]|uniref:Glycosyltransferase family 2 protein n=1 Tax=Splendidivirga corallicola TaxID=3051826 RepID=A0ABT8KQS4_9BACT|nr:glycosyltransferase family 2 protein [Fulvivirgaceae bacterium BMA10]
MENITPKVSIILPVYFGEKSLENTLKSLLSQTYSNFELIACIDGSNDNSEEILKSQNDERIQVLSNESNMGLGRTMNKLVYHSNPNSLYIAVAEQDDWYYPERLKMQVDYLEQHPDVGLVSGIAEHVSEGKRNYRFPHILDRGDNYPDDSIEMFKLNFREQIKVVNTCMMFRKEIHQNKGLYFTQHYPSLGIDWAYVLRFSLVSKIGGIAEPLVKIDRAVDRNSLTANKVKQFKASRELIRSFYWEFSNILTDKDYKTAMNTQYLLEGLQLNAFVGLKRIFQMLLNDAGDKRISELRASVTKRILRKIGLIKKQ